MQIIAKIPRGRSRLGSKVIDRDSPAGDCRRELLTFTPQAGARPRERQCRMR